MLYGKYRFLCEFEGPALMPAYKGSTLRGLFGNGLRKVVCALKQQECGQCLLRRQCLYARVFETHLAMDMPEGSRISSPPHPFVIEPPMTNQMDFEKGSLLECSLILFGEAVHSLPYFVYTFDRMGTIGVGKRINGKRGRFRLKEVRAGDTPIYSDSDQKLRQPDTLEVLSLTPAEENPGSKRTIMREGKKIESHAQERDRGKEPSFTVRVTLETPLRFKFENRLKADLPFHVLVRAMLRRISSLFAVYGNGEPDLDYQGLVNRAGSVRVAENRLSWFDWRRYSNRQERKMFMGGMTGSVTYEGNLAEYLPLLHFVEKTHLGKNTSFGLGKIGAQTAW